ncbi:MAG TPA: hypothetical protein VG779_02425 [Actinomycetota bacterium]|nr:hypothetical protein [Actinomycetota bacterium]
MIEANRPCGRSAFRITKCLFVTLAIAAALAVPFNDGPAQAATGDLACTFAAQVNFTPALTPTNTTAKASVTAGLINCISLNGMHSDLKSATWTVSGIATAAPAPNPCSLLLTIAATGPFIWSPTGEQSPSTATLNTNLSAGPITIRVDATKGVLAGDTGTVVALPLPNVDCAVNGLTSLTAIVGVLLFN